MELNPFFQLFHFPKRIYNKSFVCMCVFSLLNTQSWVCFWTLFSHGLFVYHYTNTTHSSFTVSLDPLESKSCPVCFFRISWQLHFPMNFIINLSISRQIHTHTNLRIFIMILLSVNLRIRSSFFHSLCLFLLIYILNHDHHTSVETEVFKLFLISFHCLEHLSLDLVQLDLIGCCIGYSKVFYVSCCCKSHACTVEHLFVFKLNVCMCGVCVHVWAIPLHPLALHCCS